MKLVPGRCACPTAPRCLSRMSLHGTATSSVPPSGPSERVGKVRGAKTRVGETCVLGALRGLGQKRVGGARGRYTHVVLDCARVVASAVASAVAATERREAREETAVSERFSEETTAPRQRTQNKPYLDRDVLADFELLVLRLSGDALLIVIIVFGKKRLARINAAVPKVVHLG